MNCWFPTLSSSQIVNTWLSGFVSLRFYRNPPEPAQFRELPLGVIVGLGWCLLLAAANSIWSLCVLSCKITNVRGAGHFLREGLQGVQEFAYEAKEARGF